MLKGVSKIVSPALLKVLCEMGHGVTVYGHVGADLITLVSMLRIPVNMYNADKSRILRPHVWAAFGTEDTQSADYRACATYGPLCK